MNNLKDILKDLGLKEEVTKSVSESDIKKWVALVQDTINKYMDTHYKRLDPPIVEYSKGGRYYKIIRREVGQFAGSSRSVHSFVDKSTGDIYKPAGWKAPAKHPRGNIFDKDGGKSALTPQGSVVYMR